MSGFYKLFQSLEFGAMQGFRTSARVSGLSGSLTGKFQGFGGLDLALGSSR